MPHTFQRRGAEILVNTAITNNQSQANLTVLNDGGFVVVWTDASGEGTDTTPTAIKAQRFDADGNKVGGEFTVNTTLTASQSTPTIATLPSGRYVVTWSDLSGAGGDASSTSVKGQIFEADGTPVGGEFLVNTETANAQSTPSVTELTGGGFVVSWQDSSLVGGDNSGIGIKAQRYDATGLKVGGEILVNTVISGSQTAPSLVALASGGFAVAWNGAASGGSGFIFGSIRLQLFDAAGAKVGAEIVANTDDFGTLTNAKVTALSTGLVVTWTKSDSFPVGTFDVKAQLFDLAGNKVGGEFTVNTTTDGTQSTPDVDPLPGGGFLVTWQGLGPGLSGNNVYGQVFDATGAKVGVEFILSSVTDGTQIAPKVDVLPSGDIVVTWTDFSGIGGDASGSAIKAQILTLSTAAPTDIQLSDTSLSETAREDVGLITLKTIGTLNSGYVYTILSDSSGGAFAIQGNKLVVHDNSLLDFETAPQVSLLIRATDDNDNSYQETILLDIVDTPEGSYAPATGEFLVHTTVADNQTEPVITPLEGGGYLVLWRQWTPNGGASVGRGRIFDADGHPVTGELALDAYAASARPGGGFVLVTTESESDFSAGVVARIYDGAGVQVGGSIPVNTITAGEQYVDSVTTLATGGFLVTWTDYSGGSFESDVKAQLFDANGVKVGGEVMVPTATSGSQAASDSAALQSGGYVVTWSDGAIRAQMFTAAGQRLGAPISVYADSSIEGHVVGLANGGFVVMWAKNQSSGGFVGIGLLSAQVFDADGNRVGDVILIDPGVGRVLSTDLSALPWGGFVVSWAGYDDSQTNDPGIRAQVYDETGAKLGAQLIVSDPAIFEQYSAEVAVLASGDFVVGWSEGAGANGLDTKTRIYSLGEPPVDIVGTPGPDILQGTAGDDHMLGLGDDDYLVGNAGNDVMEGGAGNDVYYVDAPGDVVVEAVGQGNDRIATAVSYTLAAGAEVETLEAINSAATGAMDLTGNGFANTITGNAGVNILRGEGGSDILGGLAGNDFLVGGTGADFMYGGQGDDTYYVDDLGDQTSEQASEGTDRIATSISYALLANSEIELLEGVNTTDTNALDLTGSNFANLIIGNAGVNILRGEGGNDTLVGLVGNDFLVGGTGADLMYGGTGDDTYYVDSLGDQANEAAGEGTDRIATSISFALQATSEVELLETVNTTDTSAMDLTGSNFANAIIGSDGVNILRGEGGNDTLTALGGDDFLVGGAGNDVMFGGTGNDTYYVDAAGDTVTEVAGQGNDRISTSVSYTLAAGSEIETLEAGTRADTSAMNLTGNATGNTIAGNDGANIIDGKGGIDVMAGYGGADTFAFTTALGSGNVDHITDFAQGIDKIALDDAVFAGLSLGALSLGAFTTGLQAQDADDRILYDMTTGLLLFDADGNGAGQAVLFATLLGAPAISAADFIVI